MILKHRTIAALVSLLYLSMAVVLGTWHDHHDHEQSAGAGHSENCAACQWQTRAATDVPVAPVIFVELPVAARFIHNPVPVIPESPFLPTTASRAPPVTPA